MSTPETGYPFPTPKDELTQLLEEALGRPVSPSESTQTTEWHMARTIVQARLQAASEVLLRIQAGQDVPDSEIDYAALAIVNNITSQLHERKSR